MNDIKIIYDAIHKKYKDLADELTEMPEDGFAPNTFYNLGTITENTTFLMAEGEEGKANHYFWVFETGADVPEITWPEDIRLWEDNKAPVIATNHHYEISVYDGVGMYEVIGIEVPDPMLSQPLTFEATEDSTAVWFLAWTEDFSLSIEVSTDGENWTTKTASVWDGESDITLVDTIATLNAGEKLYLRGENAAYYDTDLDTGCYFFASAPCYVHGNIMSLIGRDNFKDLKEVGQHAFSYLFYADNSSDDAWILSKEGTSLLLPATTLGEKCYYAMFVGQRLLETAPVLPATTLIAGAYYAIFENCESLNYVKCLATNPSAEDFTLDWLLSVANTGTFVKAAGVDGWEIDSSDGIPEGWTVVEEG